MVFKVKKSLLYVCITLGFVFAFPFVIGHLMLSIIYIICYLITIVGLAVLVNSKKYILDNDKIRITDPYSSYEVDIGDIDCIREVSASRGESNYREYEIVLIKPAESKIKIDIKMRNKKGESLFTVLQNNYNIRLQEV